MKRLLSWLLSASLAFLLINLQQAAATLAASELVINEIDYDQPGSDAAEFIEIKNAGLSPVNLDAYSLELVNGTGGGASLYQSIDLPDTSLNPGGYYVVCANPALAPGCNLDVTPETNLIQNGSPPPR